MRLRHRLSLVFAGIASGLGSIFHGSEPAATKPAAIVRPTRPAEERATKFRAWRKPTPPQNQRQRRKLRREMLAGPGHRRVAKLVNASRA